MKLKRIELGHYALTAYFFQKYECIVPEARMAWLIQPYGGAAFSITCAVCWGHYEEMTAS